MIRTYKNIFWVSNINTIGGVETFLYEIVKKYKDLDITVMYRTGAPEQINRLRKLVRVRKWSGEPIECDTLITNYDIGIIDRIKAKHYYTVLHADYSECKANPPLHKKVEQYIAVSKTAADGFKAKTGLDSLICYNPLTIEKPKKVLRLISCTRLSADKGGERMEVLAKRLTEADIQFFWTIFTNSEPIFQNPNVVFLPPRLEGIRNYIADSDYLVQLSDNEAYSYSVVEALAHKVPVLVTPFPSAAEAGVVNGVNGYVLPFDMSEIPIEDIYHKIPKFECEIKEDRWLEFMAKGKSTYQEEQKAMYRVKATDQYRKLNISDAILGRIPEAGEEFTVNGERLEVLLGENAKGIAFVEVIERIKEQGKTKPNTTRKKGSK